MSSPAAKYPELLAPVGDFAMCQAAVHAGADAIYVGVPEFNARGRAPSLSADELRQITEFCHLYGVRVFFALNILIFEDELSLVSSEVQRLAKLKPDAFIVQDIGLVRLLRTLAPEVLIHASTQMTISSAEAVRATEDLGISRYVLARENSLAEISRIRAETTKELEVFVHGAMCVSYSGQCMTSESFGGRSANRGQCAQSCRLPYELIVDGKLHPLGELKYLVSPQDLCGLEEVAELKRLGVNSIKIEGRLKSPAYVASTVLAYREATRRRQNGGAKKTQHSDEQLQKAALAPIYSRGFYSGWLNGVDHQRLVDGRFSSHLGLELGEVVSVNEQSVTVRSLRQASPHALPHVLPAEKDIVSLGFSSGAGVVFVEFEHSAPAKHLNHSNKEKQKRGELFKVGTSVYQVRTVAGVGYELRFSNEFVRQALDGKQIKPGMRVFWNSAPGYERELSRLWTERQKLKRIPISMRVTGDVGCPLEISVEDDRDNRVTVRSDTMLEVARSAPLNESRVRAECEALAGTPFVVGDFNYDISGEAYIDNREIRRTRQRAVAALIELRSKGSRVEKSQQTTESPTSSLPQLILRNRSEDTTDFTLPELSVLVRDSSQLAGVLGTDTRLVYLDYEFGKEYRESIEQLRHAGYRVGIATTRIHKPGENGHLLQIERLQPDAVLVRNLGALQFFRERLPAAKNRGWVPELLGDFSLNIANHLTLDWFVSHGLARVVPSYDLNIKQLRALLANSPAHVLEITAHHYIPAFHMEHCVFAACLSEGSSYRDCGRPCEKHRVELIDRTGIPHPLKADAECRNTMFHGTPQSVVRFIPEFLQAGVRWFRLETLYEDASQLRSKLEIYSAVLKGELAADLAFQRLATLGLGGQEGVGIGAFSAPTIRQQTVSEGQLINLRTHQNRKKNSVPYTGRTTAGRSEL